jgi:threonine/homoserine/homoserine lactone efflux protein
MASGFAPARSHVKESKAMISLESWLAFAAASAVLLVIPGPTILTVISYSVTQGRRAAIPLVAAVALGDSTALTLSLLGLGSVLAASTVAFTVVKVLGGAYLVWLGVRMIRAGLNKEAMACAAASPRVSRRRLFLNTYAVTATNPKGIIFYMAFLPQFLDATAPVAGPMLILAGTFVALAIINATLYVTFASGAAALLASGNAGRMFNLGGGSLLSVAGVWTALARRL